MTQFKRGWPEKAKGKNRYGKMSRQLLTCRTQWLGVNRRDIGWICLFGTLQTFSGPQVPISCYSAYLPDMPENTRPWNNQPIRVLSASIDPHLNQARALLLRHHGFDVVSTESKEYAREQIQKSRFDVLIFGNTLPQDTCWELAEVFRTHNPAGKIIEVIPSPWSAPKNRPDATVVSTDAANTLITVIREHAARS